MYRTIKIKLDLNENERQAVFQTMEQYTIAFKIAADWAFRNKNVKKLTVHHATYYSVRERVPSLASVLVEAAKDVACEAVKRLEFRKKPSRRPHSAMRYNGKTVKVYLESGYLNFSTVHGRMSVKFYMPPYFQKYVKWEVRGANLIYSKQINEFHMAIIVRSASPSSNLNGDVIGIDRGLINVAVSSDGNFFNSNQIRNIKNKYARLRQQLQAKGTRSAKKLLRKLSGKERRFVTCQNHNYTRRIVECDVSAFALEDLSGIKEKDVWSFKLRTKLNQWSYYKFEQFLEYKAEERGKTVLYVYPYCTSQRCSKCAHTEPSNRKGPEFQCLKCGFKLNADLNAARNIAQIGRTELSRLRALKPYVNCPKNLCHQFGHDMTIERQGHESVETEPATDNGHSVGRSSYGSVSFGWIKCFHELIGDDRETDN